MFKIYSQTDNKQIIASPDSTILEATLKAGINHTHVCGGNARCSTCRVYIIDGLSNCLPRNAKEKQLAERLGFPENIRLACQTKIRGNITIRRLVVDDLDIKIILKQFGDTSGTKLGQEKDLTILFTDIENYTQFAEALPAYDVVHTLNRYYQTMNDIIVQHKGIISDVAGDGILALFGVLEDRENPVLDAIDAVRAMHTALIRFNAYLHPIYNRSFEISAIGDAVNFASRIEDMNKDFGTRLLISQSAFEKVKGLVKTHKMYHSGLKGKSGEYTLYDIEV